MKYGLMVLLCFMLALATSWFTMELALIALWIGIGVVLIRMSSVVTAALLMAATMVSYYALEIGDLTVRAEQVAAVTALSPFIVSRLKRQDLALDWVARFFLLFLLINGFFSVLESQDLSYSIRSLGIYAICLIIYLEMLSFIRTKADFFLAMKIFLAFAFLESLYGITFGMVYWPPPGYRAMGTLLEPNIFGSFQVGISLLLVPIAGLCVRQKRMKLASLCIGFLLLSLVGLFFSYTRGAWIGFVAGAFVIYLFWMKASLKRMTLPKLFLKSAVAMVFLVALFLSCLQARPGMIASPSVARVLSTFDRADSTTVLRMNQYENALQERLQDPLRGFGIWASGLRNSSGAFGEPNWLSGLYFQAFYDAGIFGLLAMLLFNTAVIHQGLCASRSGDPFLSIIGQGLTAGFIGVLVAYQFTPALNLGFFWVYTGLLVATGHLATTESNFEETWGGK